MFNLKLVRDNIPEIIKKKEQLCNYAQIKNPELLNGFLREKLVEEVNEFLQPATSAEAVLEELVDIITVAKAIYKAIGFTDEHFDAVYKEKLKRAGGFEKGYILFFDPPAEEITNSEATDEQ